MKPTVNNATLVWFRNDLRLADNAALSAAAQRGPIVPVFIAEQLGSSSWPIGSASKWWLHQSLTALAVSLKRGGARLVIGKGDPAKELVRIAMDLGISRVFWNRRYEPHLRDADLAVNQELRQAGIEVQVFAGNALVEPWSAENKSGNPFQVFTPFWKAMSEKPFREPLPVPAFKGVARVPAALAIEDLGLEPSINWTGGLHDAWTPGEEGAAARLAQFHASAGSYQEHRDQPAIDGTSLLSPHLAFGEITPRQIWHAIPVEAYRRQLAWREFAIHLLHHFPHTPEHPLRSEFERFPWKLNEKAFRAWRRGQTGYPIVDAGMRQLWHTGWMHNRVRMVAASLLVKHLLIPWQEGARWFWDTLVDADLANNTLGWQWVAGCGADAAPYFRIFNPVMQGEKFDPEGTYVRRWVPELAHLPSNLIHQPWEAPALSPGYPAPIVEHSAGRERALAAFERLKQINNESR